MRPILTVVAATAVRLALLVSRPLWHDELFTLWVARQPPARLVETLRMDSGPPLFYILEKPFLRLAEAVHHDFVIRALSFAAALLIFAILPRGGSRVWFVLLAASSPLLLVYAADARPYALLALLALLLFALLFREDSRPAHLWGAAAVAAAALWTHYLAIFLLIACALVLLARRRFQAAAIVSGAALTFCPWIPIVSAQPRAATAWMNESIGASAVAFLSALGGAGRIPIPLGGPLPGVLFALGAVLGCALLAIVGVAARKDRNYASGLALVLLTMTLILGASLIRPIAFPGRSEMVVISIWLCLLARAAQEMRFIRWLVTATIAVALAASIVLVVEPQPEPVASRVVALVAPNLAQGDQLIASSAFYLPARLAHDRGQLDASVSAFPPGLAAHPGWTSLEMPTDGDYQALDATLSSLSPGRRAYVVLHPIFRNSRIDRLLLQHGPVRTIVERPDALVLMLTAR